MKGLLEKLERHSYVISLVHEKGGVGKTTLSQNLADAFQRMGFKVLLVDTDPSKALSKWDEIKKSTEFTVDELTTSALFKNIYNKKKHYHLVIVDGAPGVNQLASSLINASSLSLVPITPCSYDIMLTKDLINLIKVRQEMTGGKPECAFIFNRVVKNAKISRKIQNDAKQLEIPWLDTLLYNYILYPTAADRGETIFSEPKSPAILEINNLAKEIIEKYLSKVESEEFSL